MLILREDSFICCGYLNGAPQAALHYCGPGPVHPHSRWQSSFFDESFISSSFESVILSHDVRRELECSADDVQSNFVRRFTAMSFA